jgi:leucyl aminopeptidase
MQYSVKSAQADNIKTACVIVGVHEEKKLSDAAARIDRAGSGYLSALLKKGDLNGQLGRTKVIYKVPGIAAERVLIVGCGPLHKTGAAEYQQIHAAALRELGNGGADEAVSFLHEIDIAGYDQTWKLRQAVIYCEDAGYRFDHFKQRKSNGAGLRKLAFGLSNRSDLKSAGKALAAGKAIANGMTLTKTLGNLPGNICTPTYLAKQAQALSRRYPAVKTTVLNTAQMKKLGMGSLLSVAQGSTEPPKLVVMQYRRGGKTKKPLVLVGKGITFDSGGISIKPALAMDEMKFDMCGAASVIGTMSACAELAAPVNLIGIIACAENMPSGGANKPGDIVTSMSGQTIEVLNTDAEGRLVLCDALTYAERYKPAAVIDIATLTGACIIALGRVPSGVMGNNAQLIEDLKQAGARSMDRVWELPLWDEYKSQLQSNFADLANVGNREAGSIIGGIFLANFTSNYPWAHLDIAGTAWKSGGEKGATGRPVPLLMEYILAKHAAKSK